MTIGIHDLDDDDLEVRDSEIHDNPPGNEDHQDQDQEDTFMSDFLKTRGIDDLNSINFEDDNGQVIQRSWKDLSNEEKFNILNTPLSNEHEDNQDLGLTEEEIQLLDTIRRSNLTPSQYISQLSGEQAQEPQYKIDDLSDDELFLLDLESRVGELTDEVASQALANAKQNEDLFIKQVEGIRKEYKEREDYQLQQEEAALEQQQQEAYNQFQETVIDSISKFNSVGNLDLNFDDSDREELAQFMLSRDEAGNNYLWQALQDPETLVKAAWFILNGDEAFNNVSEYFIKQMKLVSENQYKKGLEEGKKGTTQQPPRTQVVFNTKQNNHRQPINSINDLDDDD